MFDLQLVKAELFGEIAKQLVKVACVIMETDLCLFSELLCLYFW